MILQFLLQDSRKLFNINKLAGKPETVQGKIIMTWAKIFEYTFFLNINPKQLDNLATTLIQKEISFLETANDFLNKLILYSPVSKEENKNQRFYNRIIIKFLNELITKTHPVFNDYDGFIKSMPEFDMSLADNKWLKALRLDKKVRLKYSADPKYLINGFSYLKVTGLIDLDNIENFVHTNFTFSPRYKIPEYVGEYEFKWLGKAKSSFPQLLGELKIRRNIIATHEEIADFVVQFINIKRDSAYQYASFKEKLTKNNIIDYKAFTR